MATSLKTVVDETKHGMWKTPEYRVWINMKRRCTKTYGKDYKNYTLRQIKVCSRWVESFINFYSDMGARPIDGQRWTLDRIDNNLGYSPENCRWATYSQQNFNRRPPTRHPLSEEHKRKISLSLIGNTRACKGAV